MGDGPMGGIEDGSFTEIALSLQEHHLYIYYPVLTDANHIGKLVVVIVVVVIIRLYPYKCVVITSTMNVLIRLLICITDCVCVIGVIFQNVQFIWFHITTTTSTNLLLLLLLLSLIHLKRKMSMHPLIQFHFLS